MPSVQESGKKIANLRRKLGMTQEELAKKVGVTVAAIGNYESGIRAPKDIIKMKLADALGESVERIFFSKM